MTADVYGHLLDPDRKEAAQAMGQCCGATIKSLYSFEFAEVHQRTLGHHLGLPNDVDRLDRLKLALMTSSYAVVRPMRNSPAASSTVTSIGYPNCDIEQLSESMGNFILLLSEERYLRPLYKEPLENGLFEQIR